MNPLVLIAAIVLIPTAVLTVLRVNAVMVLLALCLGSVLVQLAGNDAGWLVNLFTSSKLISDSGTSLIMLLIPPVFATVVLIGTVHSKFHVMLNALPALGVGLIGLMLAVPLLSSGMRSSITATQLWHKLQMFQALTVITMTILCVVVLAVQRQVHIGGGKYRGRHH